MNSFDKFIMGMPINEVLLLNSANLANSTNEQHLESISSSEEEITLEYIIAEKPKVKIVREFFRENLAAIKSEEAELFEGI